MSLVSEYLTVIKPRMDDAVNNGMVKLADGLQETIQEMARDKVYNAYGPGHRRGIIGNRENLEVQIGFREITVTNKTPLQGTDYGVSETDFVEGGYSNYNQPFPRPFMEPARDDFVDSGKADAIMADALRAAGFDVV